MLRLFLFILFCFRLSCFSQIDLEKTFPERMFALEDDSNKVIKLNDYAWDVRNEPDSAIRYSKKALVVATTIKWYDGIADTYHQLGIFCLSKGEYDQAIANYTKSIRITDQFLKDPDKNKRNSMLQKKAKTLGNLGNVYLNQGLFTKAIEYFLQALHMNEQLGNLRLQAVNMGNLGIVYKKQKDYKTALNYYFKTLQITKDSGNYIQTYANTLGNIGLVYTEMENFNSALSYYFRALELARKNGFGNLEANTLGNIGLTYAAQEAYTKAIDFNLQALELSKQGGDKAGEAYELCNIGGLYLKLRDFGKSKTYLEQALKISTDINDLSIQKDAYQHLSKLYAQTGKGLQAYQSLEKYMLLKDSMANEEGIKEQSMLEAKFQYDRKASSDSVAFAKEKQIKNVEIEKQKIEIKAKRNQQYALFGGLALVVVFAGFMFNRFKVTQKQKRIIELKEQETQKQKHIIEEKHKEITDSINYAERIQRSFLATKTLLDEQLKDYFVFFKPKDVVSGDFYWASVLQNDTFVFATADSTGHGVPGAIMSLLNITSLEKAVEKQQEPDAILNETRQTIIERLKKDGSPEGGKDGMDCSVCAYDFKMKVIHIAAANNPVWIVRNSKSIPVLEEIKSDKMPVGKSDKQDVPFTLHTIFLETGDIVYTLTDGFADQFGGSKNKKFMSKNLKALLLAHAHLPMQEQKALLETHLKNWMGNTEQVDDVTVIGVRIL